MTAAVPPTHGAADPAGDPPRRPDPLTRATEALVETGTDPLAAVLLADMTHCALAAIRALNTGARDD